MASIRMMPSDVVTAHAEYSFSPTKYRLSNTFIGSACQRERSGGPCWAGAGGCDAAGGAGGAHNRLNNPACRSPAAVFAAATWTATPPAAGAWAATFAAPTPAAVANADATRRPKPRDVIAPS